MLRLPMRPLFSLVLLALVAALSFGERFVVRFAPDASPPGVAARHGVEVLDDASPAPFALVEGPEGIENLRQDPDVVFVEREAAVEGIPGHRTRGVGGTVPIVWRRPSALSQNAWVLAQMGWSDAFAEGGRRTARVGILDTGLTPRTDLWRQVVASHNVLEPGAPAFDQPNGIDENANGIADEGAGHGSMVAGVVNLVAPRAELVIVKVADDEGESTSWRIMRGVLHAVMEGCQVINISLGTDVPLNALECIVEFAMERGVLIVAPSGNDGLEVVLNPSRIRGVLSVAGLEKDDRKADFSNYGERIDVSAPADGISSLWHDGTVASYSGTSFSSPLAAGAAAIAIQHLEQVPDAWNLASLIRSAGRSINNQNPGYEGKLGTALSVSRLASYGYSGPDGTCLVLDAPEAVAGGSTFWVTLTLNQPAPKDIWLNVSASEASVLTPQWVLIPVGAKTATFDVCTTAVSRPLEATLCVWNETLYAAKVMMIRPPSGTP